jgi:hypothetical protein
MKFSTLFSSIYHKKFLVLTLFLLFCAFTAFTSAHPPSEMTLEYDTDAHLLSVTLTHSVSDPSLHFVYLIEISLNDSLILHKEYDSQPTAGTFSYTYPIDAKPGDTFHVFADCNLGGSIEDTIMVGEGPSTRAPPTLWPYHAIFMTSGLLLMAVSLLNVLQKTPPNAWLKAHKTSGTLSVLLVIIGLSIALYMVSQSGGSHFRVSHAYIGIAALITSFLMLILGFVALRKRPNPPLRSTHIWIGRIAFVLIILTVISGLYQAGLL